MVKKWEVYWCEMAKEAKGSEQKGTRPVIILQNDIGNRFSPTTIVCVLTKKTNSKKNIPTHVEVGFEDFINPQEAEKNKFVDSVFMAEQIFTVDLSRIKGKIGHLNNRKLTDFNRAIKISLGMTE